MDAEGADDELTHADGCTRIALWDVIARSLGHPDKAGHHEILRGDTSLPWTVKLGEKVLGFPGCHPVEAKKGTEGWARREGREWLDGV